MPVLKFFSTESLSSDLDGWTLNSSYTILTSGDRNKKYNGGKHSKSKKKKLYFHQHTDKKMSSTTPKPHCAVTNKEQFPKCTKQESI